ncbi:hypothetical protein AQF98_12060 [Pedobacter sp. Hv1]|nr:hypothetical protein AQF98_12060 [Pedobacter sp. Hv1]
MRLVYLKEQKNICNQKHKLPIISFEKPYHKGFTLQSPTNHIYLVLNTLKYFFLQTLTKRRLHATL